ncbi:MAG: TadE/TadG family type IV pilus assembly protein [Marmoricola sp.]
METALCLVFIVLPIVFAIVSYAYMFSFRQALSQSADEGARAAVGASMTGCPAVGTATTSFSTFSSSNCAAEYYASQAVASNLSQYNMSCGTNYLTCTITLSSCNSGANTCISVQVGYPYRSHSLLPTIPGFGFVLPPNMAFTSSVTVS